MFCAFFHTAQAFRWRLFGDGAFVCRYNSYLGGPYFDGYRGYSGTPRITLTLVVVVSFGRPLS